MKKIYIAGKMTGLPDFGRKHFKKIKKILTDDGWVVLNPAILPIGLSDHNYMSICTAMLMSCDAIYMLDNWKESEGAVAEYSLAAKLCLDIFYEEDEKLESDDSNFNKGRIADRPSFIEGIHLDEI